MSEIIKFVKVEAIKKIGKKNTYDLKVENIHNFFLSNNILTHNSGKGTAINFFNKIARKLKNYDNNTMRLYSSGVDTTASMIDNLVYDTRRREYTDEVRPGIVSSNDIICWEEAISLFKPIGEFNEGKVRVILDICEPYGSVNNIHTKLLRDWPRPTHTTSSASIIATSRPIANMRGEILYSGLFPRFLTYIRYVDYGLRKRMNEASSLNSFGDEQNKKQYDDEERELIKELIEIQKFGKENDVRPEPRDKILKLVSEKISILEDDCYKQIGGEENRAILETFISRMRNNLVKISCHSAIMRKSTKVELCDVEYAFDLILKSYNSCKVWIELDTGGEENKEMKRKISVALNVLDENSRAGKLLNRTEFAHILHKKLKFSLQSAYSLIKRMSEGGNSYITIDENKYVRKNTS